MSEIITKTIKLTGVRKGTTQNKKTIFTIIDKYDNQYYLWDRDIAVKAKELIDKLVEISLATKGKWKTVIDVKEVKGGYADSKKQFDTAEKQDSIEAQCALKEAVNLIIGLSGHIVPNEDFNFDDIITLIDETAPRLFSIIKKTKAEDTQEESEEDYFASIKDDEEQDDVFDDEKPEKK